MTQISFTIFKNIYDNKTNKRMDLPDFNRFEELLFNMSRKRLHSKKDAQLISPACYKPDTTRKNINVTEWAGWACLDVDDWTECDNLEEKIHGKYGNYRYICYSTASSTRSHPKFRVVFPIDRRISSDKIPNLWWALNESTGSTGDRQVKDMSRMYYIPGSYYSNSDAYNFFYTHHGSPDINVDELISKYPMPEKKSISFFDKLPLEMQERILQKKKDSLENTDIKWSSYHDCPFWPKQLESEYRSITNTGWYHKMYQIMIATAGKAIDKGYPITPHEITQLIRQFDAETGRWYENRSIEEETKRALEFVFKNKV